MIYAGPREAPVKPQVQSVPEPGSLALLALGMIGVAFASKGKSKGAGTVASLGCIATGLIAPVGPASSSLNRAANRIFTNSSSQIGTFSLRHMRS